MARKVRKPRLAWALTGSGHFFTESLELMSGIADLDLFVSKAANEVVRMYKQDMSKLPKSARVFKDTTASAAPVGLFYHGFYHTLVLAPATSNTIAKCVYGISDTLATNVFAQAGKCRVPSIVFACDTAPELETMAPDGMVKVHKAAGDDLSGSHPLDDLLSQIAPFGVADRFFQQPRFRRQVFVGDLIQRPRNAGLDASDLHRIISHGSGARRLGFVRQRLPTVDGMLYGHEQLDGERTAEVVSQERHLNVAEPHVGHTQERKIRRRRCTKPGHDLGSM